MLCKLFCLCVGFAWPSSSAVGTLTGRGSCINRIYCVRAAGREKGARVFLGLGWQSKAFSPWPTQKKGASCFWGGGESKHSPMEHNEWAILSCTVFHRNRIVEFCLFVFSTNQFSKKLLTFFLLTSHFLNFIIKYDSVLKVLFFVNQVIIVALLFYLLQNALVFLGYHYMYSWYLSMFESLSTRVPPIKFPLPTNPLNNRMGSLVFCGPSSWEVIVKTEHQSMTGGWDRGKPTIVWTMPSHKFKVRQNTVCRFPINVEIKVFPSDFENMKNETCFLITQAIPTHKLMCFYVVL